MLPSWAIDGPRFLASYIPCLSGNEKCRLATLLNRSSEQASRRRRQAFHRDIIFHSPKIRVSPCVAMEPPTEKQVKLRYAFAVTGVLVGLSVAVVFAIVFHNPDTAAWALASGINTDS